jgi:hypothetical protein
MTLRSAHRVPTRDGKGRVFNIGWSEFDETFDDRDGAEKQSLDSRQGAETDENIGSRHRTHRRRPQFPD